MGGKNSGRKTDRSMQPMKSKAKYSELGKYIAETVGGFGYTRGEFAEKIGYYDDTVSNWLLRGRPSNRSLIHIADFFSRETMISPLVYLIKMFAMIDEVRYSLDRFNKRHNDYALELALKERSQNERAAK